MSCSPGSRQRQQLSGRKKKKCKRGRQKPQHDLKAKICHVTSDAFHTSRSGFTHNAQRSLCAQNAPPIFLSFTSVSPRQPQRLQTLFTSQTCQIKYHTCCHVLIYIFILIRKVVTRGGGGKTINVGWCGGGTMGLYRGLGRDAGCTLVLRCLQEMFRCFVQGRRVQLRLMSRPQKLIPGIL